MRGKCNFKNTPIVYLNLRDKRMKLNTIYWLSMKSREKNNSKNSLIIQLFVD